MLNVALVLTALVVGWFAFDSGAITINDGTNKGPRCGETYIADGGKITYKPCR